MTEIVYVHVDDLPDLALPSGLGVLAGLLASGEPVRVLGDLPALVERGDRRLAELGERPDVCIVSPYYPRAVRWLLKYAGVELAPEARRVVTQGRSVEEVLAEALGAVPDVSETCRERAREAVAAIEPAGAWRPWFPVIDFERCTACGQCAAFCLFGVYETDGQSVRVAQPQKCKNNCPACARVCPQLAIIFPKHDAAPINANDDAPAEADVMPGFGDLRDPDVIEKLRARAAAARAAAEERRKAQQEDA